MAYSKTTWANGTAPAINAANLNNIETGIYDAHEMATGRAATFVVAANDSTALAKQHADYVCDGVDDQVEIQAAIDALPSGGGKVILMEGTYNSNQIVLPDNIIFSGVGSSTLLKLNAAANDRFIINSERTTGNTNIVIENLYIDGNKDGQTAIGPTDVFGNAGCIDFRNVSNLIVRNCWIMNGWAAGLETTLCEHVFALGNRIDNSADDGIGINDQTCYATVANNIITNAGQGKNYGSPCGIEIQDGSHSFVAANNVIKNPLHDGIQVSTHTGGLLCYHGDITGNTITGTSVRGIKVAGISGQETYSVAVTGNVVDCFIVGADNGYYGIELGPYAKRCVATGNIISNTLGHGIFVRGPNTIIDGNILYDHAGKGLNLYTEAVNCIATHNQLINCITALSNTGTNNTVSANIGYVTEASGTDTIASAATAKTVTHGLAVTPTACDIMVTPIESLGNASFFWVDTPTSTQFTIHLNAAPGADVDFAWKAVVL